MPSLEDKKLFLSERGYSHSQRNMMSIDRLLNEFIAPNGTTVYARSPFERKRYLEQGYKQTPVTEDDIVHSIESSTGKVYSGKPLDELINDAYEYEQKRLQSGD